MLEAYFERSESIAQEEPSSAVICHLSGAPMSALAAGFVLVPASEATSAQTKRRKQALNVSRFIGAWCRLNGHIGVARGLTTFYLRVTEASAQDRLSGNSGRLASHDTDKMVVKLDGCRQVRSSRRRQEAVRRLGEMGLMDYGRGWVLPLPMGPKLVSESAEDRASKNENLAPEPPLDAQILDAPIDFTVIRLSEAEARLAEGKPCLSSKKDFLKNPTRTPQNDARLQRSANAASRTIETRDGQAVYNLFMTQVGKRPDPIDAPASVDSVPCARNSDEPDDSISDELLHYLNASNDLSLCAIKVKKAQITAQHLIDAIHTCMKKHEIKPFDNLEGAIMHSALQRKAGKWGSLQRQKTTGRF